MNVKPSLGRLLVKKIKPEKSIGGIMLPESSQEKSAKGVVCAVGSMPKDKDFSFKEKDVVYFPKWGGTQISSEGSEEEYVVIKMEEILGVEN